jgi:hypothetical protein
LSYILHENELDISATIRDISKRSMHHTL